MNNSAHYLQITSNQAGQRLDNFIRKTYPDLPKSRIYQMIRKGEVRVNKKRVNAEYKIQLDDQIRLPPIKIIPKAELVVSNFWLDLLKKSVIYQDDNFLILNKPANIAVHKGSNQDYGVIEVVNQIWGKDYAHLAHRLDLATSGCLLLGKNRSALIGFQNALLNNRVEKRYFCVVVGKWRDKNRKVVQFLQKGTDNKMHNSESGKKSCTFFKLVKHLNNNLSLVEAKIVTGRTHQIRMATVFCGNPILGDEKYGDFAINRKWQKLGFDGLFLHAHSLSFNYDDHLINVIAPLPVKMQKIINQ